MNKKIEYYNNKSNKIIKTFVLIGSLIIVLAIILSITIIQLNLSKGKENKNGISVEGDYVFNLANDLIIYEPKYSINFKIRNYLNENKYKVTIKVDNKTVLEETSLKEDNNLKIELGSEGKKNVNITVLENDNQKLNNSYNVYYIKPYNKQFLDELSNKSVQVHYIDGTWEKDYEKSLNAINNCGIKTIKSSFVWSGIEKTKDNYDFSFYDKWISKANSLGINVYGCINRVHQWGGDDKNISNNEEVEHITKFFNALIKKYPQVKGYDIINEPNIKSTSNGGYITEEELKWYSQMINSLSNTEYKNKVVPAALANIVQERQNAISITNYFNEIYKNGAINNVYNLSYHVYEIEDNNIQDTIFSNTIEKQNNQFNDFGGFVKTYITEYGVSSYNNITEQTQAEKLVQQTVLLDKYGVDFSNIYNFWNTGNEPNNKEKNFGLVNNNYTPKLSYYSMKNFYTNTNGSEYVGYISDTPELEEHVYNKDGKPLIIVWSNNKDKNIDYNIKGMNAKDLFGNEIIPDANGIIKISTAPVYLYNVPTSYYYKAASNVITKKYREFKEKFPNEISKVQNLNTSIENLESQIKNINNSSILSETTVITFMKQHYELGNNILKAYQDKTVQTNPTKISSMLDFLNDIGDTYEDIVTVSTTNANVDLASTKKLIEELDNKIKNNGNLIYPKKILEFSKDLYEKANYINGLSEENGIKKGLIASKNLHSSLLVGWAYNFASTQLPEIQQIDTPVNNSDNNDGSVTIIYSTTDITNKDVKATIQSTNNIEIINNFGSKDFIFTQNGTFTFVYKINDQIKKITATVNNIDRTVPEIFGVEDDKLYVNPVIPFISASDLKKIYLYRNSIIQSSYKNGDQISQEGIYTLIAEDLAGNQARVVFYINKNPVSIVYSNKNITNENVIATVVSDYDFEINNNNNNKSYTFTKNGYFVFEYTVKGYRSTITAVVKNIY